MADLRDLYQEVILEHSKVPRNYRGMAEADHKAEGFNPLCGDRFTVYLHMDGGRIHDISFQGSGCAISKASASMMTTAVKGKTIEEAEVLFDEFHRMVLGELEPDAGPNHLGRLSIFTGVREFPARVKCASLAWHTLHAAIEGKTEPVSTE